MGGVASRGNHPGAHAPHETSLVEAVLWFGDAARAEGEVEWSRNGTDSPDQRLRSLAQFPGELENHIPAERKANEKHRPAACIAELAQHSQQVARQTGVVQRLAMLLRAAASSHVKAVDCETGAQPGPAQASNVTGLSRAFEAVHYDDLARNGAFRALRLHQNLNVRFGAIQPAFHRMAGAGGRPFPVVSGDRLEMRIPEERVEGNHVERTNIQKTMMTRKLVV